MLTCYSENSKPLLALITLTSNIFALIQIVLMSLFCFPIHNLKPESFVTMQHFEPCKYWKINLIFSDKLSFFGLKATCYYKIFYIFNLPTLRTVAVLAWMVSRWVSFCCVPPSSSMHWGWGASWCFTRHGLTLIWVSAGHANKQSNVLWVQQGLKTIT